MTCAEFLALDDAVKPKVVYWAEGFNKSGQPTDLVADIAETDRLVPVLVDECKDTPQLSLSKKIKEHAAAAQKSAAAQKPANMTCEEFVALDEVVQPKVVYWAEGFDRKGKPADAAVDVVMTDSWVPMLVTECKETPKLSFWQKTKKFFSAEERSPSKMFAS